MQGVIAADLRCAVSGFSPGVSGWWVCGLDRAGFEGNLAKIRKMVFPAASIYLTELEATTSQTDDRGRPNASITISVSCAMSCKGYNVLVRVLSVSKNL